MGTRVGSCKSKFCLSDKSSQILGVISLSFFVHSVFTEGGLCPALGCDLRDIMKYKGSVEICGQGCTPTTFFNNINMEMA